MAALATGRTAGRGRKVRPGPGSGLIWSRERARKASRAAGGGKLRNGWQQTLTYERDFAFDIDMRRIVAFVSIGMARFFRDQLERGERPSGFGPLPDVKKRSDPENRKHLEAEPVLEYARARPHVGYRTGYMADHWWLGPIGGTTHRASRTLKPYGGMGGAPVAGKREALGRDFLINILLDRGIDFQSVKGKAAGVLGKLFNEAVRRSVGDVTLEEKYSTREGLLPTFRGEGGRP